jgi:hypothetical protein
MSGVVLFVGALAGAYLTGRPSIVFTALTALGAMAASLVVPAFGSRGLLSRGLFALVFVVTAMWLDPTNDAATAGRRAKLTSGSSQERAEALAAMKQRGVADFSGLDFERVDFSGQDLAFLVFDDASFQGAKLVGTRLEGCSLADADLSRADLSGANLAGADIRSVVGWDKVRCDEETVLPKGWSCVDGLPRSDAMGAVPGAQQGDEPDEPNTGSEPESP